MVLRGKDTDIYIAISKTYFIKDAWAVAEKKMKQHHNRRPLTY